LTQHQNITFFYLMHGFLSRTMIRSRNYITFIILRLTFNLNIAGVLVRWWCWWKQWSWCLWCCISNCQHRK